MTPARKAALGRARERAKEVRDQLEFSNEKPKPLDEPQSVKPDIETPFPLEEFKTQININIDVPKKPYK